MSALVVAGVAAALLVSAAGQAEPSRHRVTIIASSGPFASVEEAAGAAERVDSWDVDSPNADACTESFAAVELRRLLPRCLGIAPADVTVSSGGPLPEHGDVIAVGTRRSNPLVSVLDPGGRTAHAPAAPEGFRLRSARRSGRSFVVVEGGGRVGTLYGAYALLERLGVRFIGLGDDGICWPAGPVSLPASLSVAEAPAFATRGFYAWEPRGTEEFFLWMARNRLNFWTAAEKRIGFLKMLGMKLAIGAHDVQSSFLNPAAKAGPDTRVTYFEAHPEWFGLRNGRRSPRIQRDQGDNFCTSNDDAVAELSRNMVQGLATGIWRHADVVNFWMEDGGHWCECAACQALGTPTDRLLRLVAQVNREIQRARRSGLLRRPVHLTTLAYAETLAPPSRPLPADFDYENCSVTFYPIQRCYVHAFEDPQCTEMNARYARALRGWTQGEDRPYRGAIFVGEYYNVSNYKSMPVLYTRTMPADIAGYYRLGARHMQYMHTPVRLWGTWTLNQWMFARLLWNPRAKGTGLVGEYMARRYPTTRRTTSAFYRHLGNAFANITAQKTYLGLHMNAGEPLRLKHLSAAPNPPGPDRGPSLTEIRTSLDRARACLEDSLRACTDEVERRRLREDQRRFEYGDAMMRFYTHMVRVIDLDKAGDAQAAAREFTLVERAAQALRGVAREMVETFFCPDGGFEATQAVARYKALAGKYGTP